MSEERTGIVEVPCWYDSDRTKKNKCKIGSEWFTLSDSIVEFAKQTKKGDNVRFQVEKKTVTALAFDELGSQAEPQSNVRPAIASRDVDMRLQNAGNIISRVYHATSLPPKDIARMAKELVKELYGN
jgi:hypothetical protein